MPESSMSAWRADRLLRVLLGWTSLTFLLAWLPFVRSVMDGDSYTWGMVWWGMSFGGTGISAQYWLPAVEVALGVTILWLGARGARMPFPWLLLAWHAALFTNFTFLSATRPEDFRFRGDTAGIDFSLAWVGPVLTGVFLALSVFWVVRDVRRGRSRRVAPWNRANTIWLGSLVALLPIQLVLLRFDASGVTDVVGVVTVIVQWMLLTTALRPRAA
jgi:hypothetical protein